MAHLTVSVRASMKCPGCGTWLPVNRVVDALECSECSEILPCNWTPKNLPGSLLFDGLVNLVAPAFGSPVQTNHPTCKVELQKVPLVSPIEKEPLDLGDIKKAVERNQPVATSSGSEKVPARKLPVQTIGLLYVLNEEEERRSLVWPRVHRPLSKEQKSFILVCDDHEKDCALDTDGAPLELLMRHYSPAVRAALAADLHLADTFPASLAKDPHVRVQAALAKNPRFAKEYGEGLFINPENARDFKKRFPQITAPEFTITEMTAVIRSGDAAMIEALAYNPELPPELMIKMAQLAPFPVSLLDRKDLPFEAIDQAIADHPLLTQLLKHPLLTWQQIEKILTEINYQLAFTRLAAKHPNTAAATLVEIAKNFDLDIALSIAARENAPATLVAEMVEAIFNRHFPKSEMKQEMLAFARHPNLPARAQKEIMAKAGSFAEVRLELAKQPFLQTEVAQELYNLAIKPGSQADQKMLMYLDRHPAVKKKKKTADPENESPTVKKNKEANVWIFFLAVFVVFIIIMFVLSLVANKFF